MALGATKGNIGCFWVGLSVILTGAGATYLANYIQKHIWIAYVGLAFILLVAIQLIIGGLVDLDILQIKEQFQKYFNIIFLLGYFLNLTSFLNFNLYLIFLLRLVYCFTNQFLNLNSIISSVTKIYSSRLLKIRFDCWYLISFVIFLANDLSMHSKTIANTPCFIKFCIAKFFSLSVSFRLKFSSN